MTHHIRAWRTIVIFLLLVFFSCDPVIPPGALNERPVIQEISADPFEIEMKAGAEWETTITVTADDADQDVLWYTFSADAGTFSNQYENSITYRPPAELGKYSVLCTVSDDFVDVTDSVYVYVSTYLSRSRIAFSSNRFGMYNIFTMNADGSDIRILTYNSGNNYAPSWSSDGSKIAFYSSRDGNYEIYTMNTDGSGQTRLTQNMISDTDPVWSPDGTKIAFSRLDYTSRSLFKMNSDGSDQIELAEDGIHPSWSPDGSQIAYVVYGVHLFNGIYLMPPDGSENLPLVVSDLFDIQSPSWSPDGSKIVYTSQKSGNREIYFIDAESQDVSKLTNTTKDNNWPTWSPDGTKIAFVYEDDIHTMHTDGFNLAKITNGFGVCLQPAWCPVIVQ